ncbi:DegV family protein [Solimonas marina]|uniref:EDD domain protein, DegV family n=1 Tax=Solimonas marina TaxID=2714601 RepID=A0A970B558_9GAMM|nr:DegV family protein [Solimonas marina]NKF21200.1 hypothetical protein [Solimonas marina]
MRVGIVTDASCDLPGEFLREHNIGVMPVLITHGAGMFEDDRDATLSARYHAGDWLTGVGRARTQALPLAATRAYLVERVLPFADYAFCITVGSIFGDVHDNTAKAATALLADQQSGPDSGMPPFVLRVVDSRSMLSGPGLLVAEAARCIADGWSAIELRQHLETLRDRICVYWVPDDLYELRRRARARGPRRVDWLQAVVGSAFDLRSLVLAHRDRVEPVGPIGTRARVSQRLFERVARRIENGIDVPDICISYGGTLDALHALPGYSRLASAAQGCGVRLLESVMSISGAVNVGRGCLSVAYLGETLSLDA